jgi:Ca-activated chloride channel family protein
MSKQLSRALTLAMAVLAAGCGADEATEAPDKPGTVNVSQGGAQDFAQFRAVVDEGKVPAPELLDPVGFFAEHAMDLPSASCGEDLCVHPSLAVAPRFNGANWTMAFVAMNTPLDPSTLERPPLHLVIAIEANPWISAVESSLLAGVASIVDGLRPEDRVSLVSYGSSATTHLHAIAPATDAFTQIIDAWDITADSSVALYEGLAEAQRALDLAPAMEARRVLLLTTGKAESGITDPERIVGLGEAMARSGVALGVVGVSDAYDARIPAALGSLGAGSYSFARGGQDLEDVLRLEGETTLFPLATDFRLRVEPAEGYRVGRVYGVKRLSANAEAATLDLPALFIGQRQGSHDVGGGRRGGGGGIFVELRAEAGAAAIGAGAPAFRVTATWKTSTGEEATMSREVINELPPGANPQAIWPSFSDPDRGKPFMMLNMYLALKTAVEVYAQGDCARGLGVVDMMQPSVSGWQGKYDDPDIDADNQVLIKLRQNIVGACAGQGAIEPIQPAADEGSCMML